MAAASLVSLWVLFSGVALFPGSCSPQHHNILKLKMISPFTHNLSTSKIIDSHLHIWASPQEASEFPYAPGQEPPVPGNLHFLLQNMEEAGVDGVLIVQPIFHKFDHSYVTSALKKYPTKFVGCCLANPTDDGSGLKQFEDLVLKDGYRAVRFNPELWPAGEKVGNPISFSQYLCSVYSPCKLKRYT
ncbi:hypothetical protein GmHk_18G053457 [Glycine max]|nr:hypothetical protein GmHk_18G053457 [Glycine max]